MNAVKTGVTGRTVFMPTDDAALYQQHVERCIAQHAPATDPEQALVQTIADTEWRLLRIAPLEAGIYAFGHRALADQFADEPNPANREALIQAQIFLTYRRELNNLALQERRLRNQRKADIAELQTLQQDRLAKSAEPKASVGFEFSQLPKQNRDSHGADSSSSAMTFKEAEANQAA